MSESCDREPIAWLGDGPVRESFVQVHDAGRKIVTVRYDGTVEYGEGVTPDEAIRVTVKACSDQHQRLAEQNRDLYGALAKIVALDADGRDPGFSASPDYWIGIFEAAEIARDALLTDANTTEEVDSRCRSR